MQSKNKPAMRVDERQHVERIKSMSCVVCGVAGPSEAHEIEQGLWFTCLPLCSDCHRGTRNGIHGERRMWSIHKMDELKALNETLRQICS